jgi:hypothetical protein
MYLTFAHARNVRDNSILPLHLPKWPVLQPLTKSTLFVFERSTIFWNEVGKLILLADWNIAFGESDSLLPAAATVPSCIQN